MEKEYLEFIKELKQSIITSRYIAARLANREQIMLYYKTGKSLSDKIEAQKWGAKVVEQIAVDLQKGLPGLKGFSYRNLMKMKQFADQYPNVPFLPSATAGLTLDQEIFFDISFTHHLLLLNKCKEKTERWFYIEQAASQFWSVTVLEYYIKSDLFKHQGKLANNFNSVLSQDLKTNALQVFQDEYLFDFICIDDESDERVFEGQIVANIKNSIMALGKGFSFMGNQYRLEVDGQEFFIDLLFYNRHLQCLVVFELKRGRFKPEYAGQLNFYLSVLDDKIKLPHENSSIGIILCKEKSNTVVEFAFKNINKALGAATFKTSKEMPNEMKGILPDANDLAQLL